VNTRAAKAATSTIPIVMANDNDPVGDGIVASLARPGGNITGLSNFAPELSGKRLEILREVVPKLFRVAVFGNNSTNPGYAQMLRELEPAAKAFKVKLQYLDVLDSKDIETGFRAAAKGRAQAVLTLPRVLPQFSANTDCRTRGKEPAPRDLPTNGLYGSRRPHVLWR
jgi:putative tryptophan/tyrosine transport system substrate-binding protein